MRRAATKAALAVGAAALGMILGRPPVVEATLEMQKKAKGLGYPAQNCLYCHGEKLPKKGAVTHNDRGKWLLDQKGKKNAKEIDVSWLKDYLEPKDLK